LISLVKAELPFDDKVTGKLIDFSKIASFLGSGRTAKQCRDRWNNFLRSGIKKGDWTADEVELIRDMYSTFGAK
jgi:Myb-like DNA-binding domain